MIWKDKYAVGVPVIDGQHKELFRRVTDFVTTLRSDGDWATKEQSVNDTLNFMKAYVVEHFRDEEAYQREIGYPGFEAHRKIHADMVHYVGEVAEQYGKSSEKEQLMQQFGGKLLAWLINHVTAEDQKIADYERKRGR
ncbi:MAG: hemerythrin family protein [Bacillota bacterium]